MRSVLLWPWAKDRDTSANGVSIASEIGMNRTALFLRCSEEEAEMIRDAAEREHRTVSGYILNIAMSRIQRNAELLKDMAKSLRRRLFESNQK